MNPVARADQDMAEIEELLGQLLAVVNDGLDRGVDPVLVALAAHSSAMNNLDLECMSSLLSVAALRLAQARR